MIFTTRCAMLAVFVVGLGYGQAFCKEQPELPLRVGTFSQQVHIPFTKAEGLLSDNVQQILSLGENGIHIKTDRGFAKYQDGRWQAATERLEFVEERHFLENLLVQDISFVKTIGGKQNIRDLAKSNGEVALATTEGLYLVKDGVFLLALPRQGHVRWAPLDIRAVAYDSQDRLWFACAQGVGCRIGDNDWKLYTGADGLPFNDFTRIAAGPNDVWFGTSNGAIRFFEGDWQFRQGRRWLVDNHINDIAVDSQGNAWIATPKGVSCIQSQATTLGDKAKFFRRELDQYHRRTPLGYISPAKLKVAGDKSTATVAASDNDGHYLGLYLGAVSLGYAATAEPQLKADATKAFRALAFLSEVTAGGTHPAPQGLVARAVRPTSGPDPNEEDNAERDRRRRAEFDGLWKIIEPRWPVDESGNWYWKCDSSSDELDGHYFGLGIYYDRACQNEAEKEQVRQVVRRITDHLLAHDFNAVDHDGQPTRWSHFSPEDLNKNEDWWVERGLNSLSILTYLSIAHHMTGDQKYRDAYLHLAFEHGYAMNGMTQPKLESGPGSFGQGDDRMAFMNYYHLLRYETDPTLLSMLRLAVFRHYQVEKYERNPLFNFVYAACSLGKSRTDHWDTIDLSPHTAWLEESVETLKRYPLDQLDWPHSNAHRIDMVPLADHVRDPGDNVGYGHRVDGRPFRIDEIYLSTWGHDPWKLAHQTEGKTLNTGVPFLLAYYMGLAHGFIGE